MRSLKDDLKAVIDIGIVLMIGVVFAGLMVIAYIIWTLDDQLDVTSGSNADLSLGNITQGFDDTVALVLVAITVFVLALAIAALLMLRGRKR